MKIIFISLVFLFNFSIEAPCQTEEEKKFLDTLKMGGTYLLGKPFPEFELKSEKGKIYNNECFIDKITFINFWFEACAPCIAEMNALENIYQTYSQNKKFQFLSITWEKKEVIEKIVTKYRQTYQILSTSTDSCYYLNFKKGFPTNVIVNGKGEIIYFTIGGGLDPDAAEVNFKTNVYPLLNCLLQCK
jgi:thiol-disulfide isomerase/thioredoxin